MGSGRVCLLQKDGNQLTRKVGVSGARLVPPAQPRAARGPARRTGSPVRGCLWRSSEIVVHQNSGRGSAGVGRCVHWGADRTNLCPHSARGRKSEIEVASEALSPWRGGGHLRPGSSLSHLSTCLCPSFPRLQGPQSGWNRAQPSDLVLTSLLLDRPCLQIQSPFEVLGVRMSTYEFFYFVFAGGGGESQFSPPQGVFWTLQVLLA